MIRSVEASYTRVHAPFFFEESTAALTNFIPATP